MTHPKHADPEHEILDLIRRRWSPRAFDPARGVEAATLARLFEAARWAPSSNNEQPWRFIVTDRTRHAEEFAAMFATLNAKNQAWAAAAPVLVLVALRTTRERDEAVNSHAWYDTGQAVGFLTLQATAMDLSLRQVAGFDRDAAKAASHLPDRFEPVVMIAIGYAGDPDSLELPQHRQTERQPRMRRGLAEMVYEGRYRGT
jgi:nitroreductase